MKKLILFMCAACCSLSFANEIKHQISFGANTDLAWNGSGSTAKFDSALGVDDYTSGSGNFSINYLHSISKQFQIGFIIDNETSKTEIKFDSGAKSKSESMSSSLYLLFNYNFNPVLNESWYVGLGIGRKIIWKKVKIHQVIKVTQIQQLMQLSFMLEKDFRLKVLGLKI